MCSCDRGNSFKTHGDDEKAMGPMTAESFDIFEMLSGRFETSHGETQAARSFMLL